MKKSLLILVSLIFIISTSFAQEAAKKSMKDTSNIHAKKPTPQTEVQKEPQIIEDTTVVETTQTTEYTQNDSTNYVEDDIKFGLAGMLMFSLENWEKLKTDKSKLGFGFAGDLFAGIRIDDMYFGLGPHLGYSFWTTSETISGYNTTTTWGVGDVGLQLVTAWEGFFITMGRGSGEISLTVTVDDESDTEDIPDDATYNKVGFGWYEDFLVCLTYTSYQDWAKNLSRLEISFGYAF